MNVPHTERASQPAGSWPQAGISLPEVLIVVALMAFLLAHVLGLTSSLKQRSITVSRQAYLEARARLVMDELMESLRRIGAHVPGPYPSDTVISPTPTPTPGPGATSQFAILWAQPYDLMFNTDVTDARNAVPANTVLPPGLTVTLADALTAHSAPLLHSPSPPGSTQKARAETYRFSLDAGNEDGVITGDDKRGALAPTGITSSQNPSDYALIEQSWYSDANDATYSTLVTASRDVLATGVRAWTEAVDTYPTGDLPPPLFTYWLDEAILDHDFNDNNDPTDVLLFGDEDSDGDLSQAEIAALLTTNPLGGIGRAVSEAGVTGGPDTRFSNWRNTTMSGVSNERLARMLNRSIVRITVWLRLETANAEPWVVSQFSSDSVRYRYREVTSTATATLYDQVFHYPHTTKYY